MSTRKMTGAGAVIGLLVLVLSQATCHQALLTAPPDSKITLFANPDFIPAHGGVSVITAMVVEPAGTAVADGTVVQFFTTLGRIDEQGRSNDGVVHVNLVSDSRSGVATVTAVSGGPAVQPSASPSASESPSPSPSPSASPTTSPAPPFSDWPSAHDASISSVSATMNTAEIQVTIGAALPDKVIVAAFPPRLTDKRASLITANVFDKDGNPVANVPVVFRVEGAWESMDSQGSPTFTDNNGQAQDVMRTRRDPSLTTDTVKVTVTAPRGIEGSVYVWIN